MAIDPSGATESVFAGCDCAGPLVGGALALAAPIVANGAPNVAHAAIAANVAPTHDLLIDVPSHDPPPSLTGRNSRAI